MTSRVPLSKRRYRFSAEFRQQYPMARGFHAPQREHVKQPMPLPLAVRERAA